MANEKKEIEGWRESEEKPKEIQKGGLTNITSTAASKLVSVMEFRLQLHSVVITQKKNVYTIWGP